MKTIRFNYLNTLHKEIGYEKSQLIKKIKNYIAECLEGRDNFEIPEWLHNEFSRKHYGHNVIIESMFGEYFSDIVKVKMCDDSVVVDTIDEFENPIDKGYTVTPTDTLSLLAVSEFVHNYINDCIDHQLNELYGCIKELSKEYYYDAIRLFCEQYNYDIKEIDLDDVIKWANNYKPIEE